MHTVDLAPFWEENRNAAKQREEYVLSIHGKLRGKKRKGVGEDDHFVGMHGERTISELLRIPIQPPKMVGDPVKQPDPWYDFVLPTGNTLDSKACWSPNGFVLLVPKDHPLVADWYTLVIVDRETKTGRLVGATTKAIVQAAPVIKKFCPRADAYTIFATDLITGLNLIKMLLKEKI